MKTIEEAIKELKKSPVYKNGYEYLFKAGIEFAQRWIPVEEELPETNEFYESKICLVKNTYGNVDVARYYSNTKLWYFNSSNFVVTHWRPIERQ